MSSRKVLITGGAGGIGTALAARFVQEGDLVVVGDRDHARVDEVASGLGVQAVTVDITDVASVATAVQSCGPIDVLVNNAGVLDLHGSVTELAVEALQAIFAVNVAGTFAMTQAVARQMIADHRGGAIVNVSSIGARQPTPGMGAYESSKAAIDALTRWSAIELAEHGIRVNAVAPGPVLTPMLVGAMPEGSPARQAWTQRIPLRALADPMEVADAVVFLASRRASHITGVSLPVDGGQLLT